jgi:LysW-gamma-L-lysine carboxypeptidase
MAAAASNPVELLAGLLQRFSPSSEEHSAVRYLTTQMHNLGFKAWEDEVGNAIGEIGDGPNEIILLGHIDTVSGYINVHQEDDTLWGRGSVDAKGPLATFVSAAAQVGVRPGWKITVVGAVGEEDDGRGARHIRAAHKPQYLVIGEPSQWNRVTLGYKGDAYFWYVVRRSVTHTATQLESACEAAVNFWNRIAAHCGEFNTGKTRSFDLLMPSLRSLASSSDGFTETAQLTLGFRLPPGIDVPDVEDILESYAGDGVVDLIRGEPAYRADKNNPLVRAFLAAIRRAGGEPSFALKTGTSDMNTVAPLWACPTLAYGPGDSHLDHTAEEHISITEYLKSIQILADVLTQLTR